MSNQPVITIKLEVQIHTDGTAPTVTTEMLRGPDPRHLLAPIYQCPDSSSTIQVTPSGSGATGSIAAWAQFQTIAPDDVRAQVLPGSTNISTLKPITSTPSGTVEGTSSQNGFMWTWNTLPNAGFSGSPGTANWFVVWARSMVSGTEVWVPSPFRFNGVPLGTAGASLCSGSGSVMTKFVPAPTSAKTYPALWLVSTSGFAVSPLVLFNAHWALREVSGATHPTWDNAADGRSAPHIQLKLCPKNGWELGLRYIDIRVDYTLPYQGNPFGPLVFADRQDSVDGLGAVALPKILVSAV